MHHARFRTLKWNSRPTQNRQWALLSCTRTEKVVSIRQFSLSLSPSLSVLPLDSFTWKMREWPMKISGHTPWFPCRLERSVLLCSMCIYVYHTYKYHNAKFLDNNSRHNYEPNLELVGLLTSEFTLTPFSGTFLGQKGEKVFWNEILLGPWVIFTTIQNEFYSWNHGQRDRALKFLSWPLPAPKYAWGKCFDLASATMIIMLLWNKEGNMK